MSADNFLQVYHSPQGEWYTDSPAFVVSMGCMSDPHPGRTGSLLGIFRTEVGADKFCDRLEQQGWIEYGRTHTS